MALARIITRSHQYAQQLALDLLARGYTVEVVSPDANPKAPAADLELRVEAAGSEVQGQVTEIREQGKAAKSIEYLQRLKPMMADLLRKWPAGNEATGSDKSTEFNFNAEAEYCEDVELPAEYQCESQAGQPMLPVNRRSKQPDFTESARLISPVSQQKPASSASSIFSITGEPISWAESEPEPRGNSEVWFWRAAVGFACTALLILVLGMALRKSPSAPAKVAAVPVAAQTVAVTQARPTQPTLKPAAASAAPLPTKEAVVPTAVPVLAVAKAKPSAAFRRIRVGQNNEVVSGDTTITYFNTKAAEPPKAAINQTAGIKHYSDLN